MFGPEEYLRTIARAKRAVKVPVIASLNGSTTGGWTRHARLIEDAGADALELNLYYLPTDADRTGAEIEARYLDVVRAVVGYVKIPVAVKIGPFLSSLPNFARQVQEAGAAGLVLFNRFYQPDIDLEELEVVPGLTLSRSEDLRLPLRWTAILSGRIGLDLAITTGVHTHYDVLKAVMAGANVAMMASELLEHGLGRVGNVLVDIEHWMQVHEYESIGQMRGSMSQKNVADPGVFERANYMKVLYSFRPRRDVAYALPPGRRPA
jgi:dihydroorotate dehydrogenase (fumarate)